MTRDDIDLWISCVAGLPPDSPRRDYYARTWDVAGKIRAAKLSGHWPPTS